MGKTKRVTAVALGFLASCATTDSRRADPTIFKAFGDRWNLRITANSIRLRERVGRGSLNYYGPVPPLNVAADGMRLKGELLREYVVAGLAEEDRLSYAIEITAQPCKDRKGRLWPTSVRVSFVSGYDSSGCGGSTASLHGLELDNSR
jgi:hypothetical protein